MYYVDLIQNYLHRGMNTKLREDVQTVHCNSNESEFDISSVMTRSATRKYATVGAVHNRVNVEQELAKVKRWPTSVMYSIPSEPPDENANLKKLVTQSLQEVMSFCKNAVFNKNKEAQASHEEVAPWEFDGDTSSLINLLPYFTQGPVVLEGNNTSPITLHLNESLLSQQFVNVLSINSDGQSETIVIQEDDDEEGETITLHSGNSYYIDNNIISSPCSQYFYQENTSPSNLDSYPCSMIAINNDHTYALKSREEVLCTNQNSPNKSSNNNKKKIEESNFQLENALNDLLLNTAILKCLVCGDAPQEITTLLERPWNTCKKFQNIIKPV